MEKILTSVQYHLTNNYLFNEIYGNWQNFNQVLNAGPESMKQFLCDLWNKTKNDLLQNPNVIIRDVDKEITPNDFDITLNSTNGGIKIFYFTFPSIDIEKPEPACKYVALALTPNMPQYFTLEYSYIPEPYPVGPLGRNFWVAGEWAIIDKNKKHYNIQSIDNDRLPYFAGLIKTVVEDLHEKPKSE